MKKLSIAINILLIGLIAFQACNSKNENSVPKGLVTLVNDSCKNIFCNVASFSNINGKLDENLISELSNSYFNDRNKGIISGTKNDTDALSVVFDIEKIKTLIAEMQNRVCAFGCDSKVELGIRYYYIKYPGDLGSDAHRTDGLKGLTAENSNKHSLAMVPVYRYKTEPRGPWFDYNLWTSSRGACFPKIHDLTTTSYAAGFAILPDAADNHGGIGPPPAPGTFPTNEQ